MASSAVFFHLLCAVWICGNLVIAQEFHRKFEYTHSFKGPHLVDKKGHVPFWSVHGGAVPSENEVRLTLSVRSQKGSMWNTVPYEQEHWEAELALRVNGRGRVGADGLAMWFRSARGTEGSVFGADDKWNGLGIFFDSFDNDGMANNPHILVMNNNGLQEYSHSTDGLQQQLGGCMRDFRNRPYPVHIKITYIRKELTLYFDFGNSPQPHYELCMQAPGVELPPKGYFGFSAATGGLADDHDVISFHVTSLMEKKQDPSASLPAEDIAKFQESYDDYSQKVDQQREDFRKLHPDVYAARQEEQAGVPYETTQDREIRLVLEGQNQMMTLVERLRERLDLMSSGGQPHPPADGAHGSPAVTQLYNTLQQVAQRQDRLSSALDDLRNRPVPQAVNTPGSPDVSNELNHLRATIQGLQQEMQTLGQARSNAPAGSQACPDSQCVGPTSVIILGVIEVVVFIIFVFIQKKMLATSQKKFF